MEMIHSTLSTDFCYEIVAKAGLEIEIVGNSTIKSFAHKEVVVSHTADCTPLVNFEVERKRQRRVKGLIKGKDVFVAIGVRSAIGSGYLRTSRDIAKRELKIVCCVIGSCPSVALAVIGAIFEGVGNLDIGNLDKDVVGCRITIDNREFYP